MAENSASEKTEQPTPKRLEKARGKGQMPHSEEMTSVATLLVLVAMIALLSPNLMRWAQMELREGMTSHTSVFADTKTFLAFAHRKTLGLLVVIAPILAALAVASAAASIAVGGLNFAPGALEFKFSQFNPIAGFGKLVNGRSLVRLLTSIVKLVLVSLIAWKYLWDKLPVLASLRWAWSGQMLAVIGEVILGLMTRIGVALLVVAVADAFYQKWKYREDLKMTRQEVKQEHKDLEGSPEIKGRIRRIQFETAAKRMLKDVPKATVVLVNPTHVAVALRYESKTMTAPVMVAKGADLLAERIREIARAYGVPIVSRPELARTIFATVEPGQPIPENLYVAVAEVLALIYRLRHKKR
jgi:flagellar biosynthetic protein FlhB